MIHAGFLPMLSKDQGRVVVEYYFLTSSECTLGMLHMKVWAIEGTFHLCSSAAVHCRVFVAECLVLVAGGIIKCYGELR